MKRPERKNYDIGEYGEIKYIDRLERYCSYLENKNQALQLQQTGVSGRSEQLVSFLQWYIKDDMIREKKELIKSVVERYLKETNCH